MNVPGKVCPGPVSIGNPREFTIRQLAEMVIEMTGAKSRLINCPLPKDDPKQRQPNISRARELLDWSPKTEVEVGLRKTIDYFDKLLSNEDSK